jgi:hypothetical protein
MDGPEVGPFLGCRGNKDGIFIAISQENATKTQR